MAKKRKAKAKAASSQQQKQRGVWWTSSSTHHTAVVSALGVVFALIWTYLMNDVNDVDGSLQNLLDLVRSSDSFELTNISARTLTATNIIPSGTVLMDIPRSMMVWDLDAARDDFIRKEIFGALREQSLALDPMSKRAILLSAYLALLRKDVIPATRLQLSVAKNMPSYEEYAAYHPILIADINQLKRYLGGGHSPAYIHLVNVRKSLNEEYNLLSTKSTKFASHVSREDYLSCRIAVQSRAFEISNIPSSEVSEKEREYYQRTIGIDFRLAAISIEFVTDWMNTHINNNVKVGGYDSKKRRGLAWATKDIPEGHELINSYGEHFYDYVLFSQYGFIPSDGTGSSIATLFVHHNISLTGGLLSGSTDSLEELPQLDHMYRYLRYDYGYPECITEEAQPEAFELKRLKAIYLQRIAFDRHFWVLPMPPRTAAEEAKTPQTTTMLPEDYILPSFGSDIYDYLSSNALSVSLPCRLITLTNNDVEDAMSLLQEDLERQNGAATPLETPALKLEELESNMPWMLRTIHCMKDLASTQLQKYSSTVEDQANFILNLVDNKRSINTLEWNAAHVQLEEMQSNQALLDWAHGALGSLNEEVELFVRDEPCPES